MSDVEHFFHVFIGCLCVKGNVYPTKCRFPKTAWRDNKVFFNEQCIKLEENKRRGKSRDLFRKLEVSREHIAQRRTQ